MINAAPIERGIRALLKQLPSADIEILRTGRVFDELGAETVGGQVIYRGVALVVPSGGTVAQYGLGQTETEGLTIVLPGSQPVQQGDHTTIEGRRYRVGEVTRLIPGVRVLRLTQWGQQAW